MSKATEITMLVEGALLFGGAPGAESLEVRLGSPRKAGFQKIFVPMKVAVPLDNELPCRHPLHLGGLDLYTDAPSARTRT